MARKRVVTRTITVTHADVSVLDKTTGTVEIVKLDLLVPPNNGKNLLNTAKKVVDNETKQAVYVGAHTETTELRGMTEEEFYTHSRPFTSHNKE